MEKVYEKQWYIYVQSSCCWSDGEIYIDDNAPEERKDKYFYSPDKSIWEEVAEHFENVVKWFNIKPWDWQHWITHIIDSVFCQYYISKKKTTWGEIEKEHIKEILWVLRTEDIYDGYSEVTITDNWTELFIGWHDIRKEFATHKGKYLLMRIKYNTNMRATQKNFWKL